MYHHRAASPTMGVIKKLIRIIIVSWALILATHPSFLAWRIPWTEKPGRLQSTGSQSRTWLSMHICIYCCEIIKFSVFLESNLAKYNRNLVIFYDFWRCAFCCFWLDFFVSLNSAVWAQLLCVGSRVCRLSCSTTYRILVPWPGIEPESPALEGGFFTIGPQGCPNPVFLLAGVMPRVRVPETERIRHPQQCKSIKGFITSSSQGPGFIQHSGIRQGPWVLNPIYFYTDGSLFL